jgi:C_GCAxxG_C_C family probable redox protein
MSRHGEQAQALFEQGYNCAQSVFAAFCDVTGLDMPTALRLSSPFGGGMGRMREVCGAVSGMLMTVGLLYGYENPNDDTAKESHYRLVQALALRFQQEHGSLVCRDLLGLSMEHDSPIPQKRTEQYYQIRPCAALVARAAELLDEILERRQSNMIIAVANQDGKVSEHFGHCESFQLFEARDGRIVTNVTVPSPEHKPGLLPDFLHEKGAQVVIAGGMGGGAMERLRAYGIHIILGAQGDARSVAEEFLQGTLQTQGDGCQKHEHHGSCGGDCQHS